MKTKLTKQDYQGYLNRILEVREMKKKADQMEAEQNAVILPWLEERIKKAPNAKKPKKR